MRKLHLPKKIYKLPVKKTTTTLKKNIALDYLKAVKKLEQWELSINSILVLTYLIFLFSFGVSYNLRNLFKFV